MGEGLGIYRGNGFHSVGVAQRITQYFLSTQLIHLF
ncbi:Uncharacterised protein [Vibrio cholerae]|nr:Uncharacterised protein [Vibrio cholerae]CSC95122.1 Uncharacterised protein [Vibrio cholerae]